MRTPSLRYIDIRTTLGEAVAEFISILLQRHTSSDSIMASLLWTCSICLGPGV